ncbi:uncharacterized protein LOC124253734 isoform X2 [Haliotis rubra]|uniref:uncharacterized protein LOC124253734 isoform X2 n=1 Tax=Haliotis rubra TaxID=36100 RepID=UPI001EE5CF06|nr:uncharacterized protein LOC124253734 isoform X2 [Haliotis rubra]
MKITAAILLLASVAHYVSTASNGSYCTSGSTQSKPTDPPFPDLPRSFQTRLEANLIDQGFTMEVAEYADDDGNRAALTLVRGGDFTDVVFDYKAGQVYTVHDGVCVTKTMSNDTADLYLFGDIGINGTGHIFSTNDIIKFAKRYGETYLGQSEVRGINCDKWRTCMYWDYFKANFTLDYYFSALNWTTSMTYPQVPVRADVTGIMRTASGQMNFHHIYDYYDFRPGIEPGLTVFETPQNVVCPHRKSLKLIPKIANQFYFRLEDTNVPDAHTVNKQAWYDKEYKVIRMDYPDQGRPAIHIDDFNRGTRYTIDKEYGNCSMTSLPDTVVDSKRVGKDNHWFLELLDPLEFLRLQANFVYVGQRTVRGLNCDLFVATVTGKSAVFYTNTAADNVTVEAYFSRSSNESADTGVPGDKGVYSHVIVQIITYINQTQLHTIMNFYDFDFGHPDPVKTFDLTPCFTDAQQIGFSVRFPVSEAPDLLPYDVQIQNEALKELSVGLQLEPTRLQHLHVHTDDDNVYVSGKLLDRPPLLARYYVIPDQTMEVIDAEHDVTSVEECAAFCDVETYCVTFVVCGSICYLSHVVQQYSVNPDLGGLCDRYSAVVQRPKGLPDHDLQAAWSAFNTLVSNDSLTLHLSVPGYPDQGLGLLAREVVEDDIWRQSCQDNVSGSSGTATSSTDASSPAAASTSEETTPTAASNTPSSHPETSTENPRTSPEVTSGPPSVTSSAPVTKVTTPKTRTTQTTMPLTTTRNTDFKRYKTDAFFDETDHAEIVDVLEECLQDCIEDPLCQTVTLCLHKHKCDISHTSVATHENLVKPQSGCDIYSLSSNFPKNGTTTVTPSPQPSTSTSPTGTVVSGYTLVAVSTVPGIAKAALELIPNVRACGKACTKKAEFHCTAFQYCPSNKICNLMDNRLLPVPLTLKINTTCPYYNRQFLDDFTLQTGPPAANSNFKPLNGVSLQKCADMCGHEGASCISFQYCLNTKACLIGTTQKVKVANHQPKSSCQYYKRPLPPGGQTPDHQPLGSSGYTGGSLAGMAVGMLIVGTLAGLGCLFLIQRQRKRTNLDVNMHIME